MSEGDYQPALEQRCGFKDVLTNREECMQCPGYDPNCPSNIDERAPEQEALQKYQLLKQD